MIDVTFKRPTGGLAQKICVVDFIDEFGLSLSPNQIRGHLRRSPTAPKKIAEISSNVAYYNRAEFLKYMKEVGILKNEG